MVTYAELVYGVERSSSKRINRLIIEGFVRHLDVLLWDVNAASQYAIVRAQLEANGTPIGAMVMMISAHAKSKKFARLFIFCGVSWAGFVLGWIFS